MSANPHIIKTEIEEIATGPTELVFFTIGSFKVNGPVLAGACLCVVFIGLALKPRIDKESVPTAKKVIVVENAEIGGEGPSAFTERIDSEIRAESKGETRVDGFEEKLSEISFKLGKFLGDKDNNQ